MKSYSILALFALAFHSAQADHSKTPSVSNIPSNTNTQSPTSTPVPSGTQDASLIAPGAWEQLAHFQSCDDEGYLGKYSTQTATYFYNIDQSFDVVQNIYWYQRLAQCENEVGAYLHVALEGTGGPFGLTLLNEDFTLQRMEFTNISIDVQGWRGVKLMQQTDACELLDLSTNTTYNDLDMGNATADNCPFWISHWSLPHYNAYDSHGDQLMSVSKCTEDILADFDDLTIGTLIKSPDSPSVTATASMSPSTDASLTPSNSPLGPYYTNWMQKLPTLHCTATTPYRTNYDIFFDQHNGTGTGEIFVSGNYTTYPTRLMCQNDLNRLSFSQIQGSGNCYLDSARKEGSGDSYTLCTWTPSIFVFRSIRWRATKAWNDMVSGCRHNEDAITTGGEIAFDPSAVPSGTCELFSDFTNKLYFTTHQDDFEGYNNHVGHRVLHVSDMYTYWTAIDRDNEIDFEPLGRGDTYNGDKPFTYLDLADYASPSPSPSTSTSTIPLTVR